MDGDLSTVRLSPYLDTRYIFELDFQFRRFEVNQHHVTNVMHVVLKSGQSASREEVVEEMHECRSMKQHFHRSSDARTWAKHISRPIEAQKPHKVTKIPMDDQKPYLCISKPLLTATSFSIILFYCFVLNLERKSILL